MNGGKIKGDKTMKRPLQNIGNRCSEDNQNNRLLYLLICGEGDSYICEQLDTKKVGA